MVLPGGLELKVCKFNKDTITPDFVDCCFKVYQLV